MHKLNGSRKCLVNAGNHVIVNVNLDLEAFKVDVWGKVAHTFVDIVNDVIHEYQDTILMVFE